MSSEHVIVPPGAHRVNALIATADARALIRFLAQVFDAVEDKSALAISEGDGKVFNSDVRLGDTHLNIFDRKQGWKHMPSLLQVYVKDINDKLDRAVRLGAEIVTRPTDFYGGKLARFIDPQGNLWWLYELFEEQPSDWSASEGPEGEEATDPEDNLWLAEGDDSMTYLHDSLVEGMKRLGQFE